MSNRTSGERTGVFATLRLSSRDSNATNQGLETLILAQGVEYRLDFEVDHHVVAFLKTLLQPLERALFVTDAHTRHGRQHRRRIARLRGFSVILHLAPPISLRAVSRHR